MNEQGSSNGSFRSKFQQRLKRMKLLRIFKFKYSRDLDKESQEQFIAEVINNIKSTSGDRSYSNKKVSVPNEVKDNARKENVVQEGVSEDKVNNKIEDKTLDIEDKYKGIVKLEPQKDVVRSTGQEDKDVIRDTDKAEIKRKAVRVVVQEDNDTTLVKEDKVNTNVLGDKVKHIKDNKPRVNRSKSRKFISDNRDKVNTIDDVKKHDLLNEMGTDIINKLKDSFEDKLDELEVLHSELYLLSTYQDSQLELKKVEEVKKKINIIIDRINEIIEQYNLYKRNYYIDNVIGIDDSIIVDDIINYRYLLDSFNDEKKFVKEYKALEEFKSLYNNLVEIKEETETLQKENEEKIEEYDIRDKKHDGIKLKMIKDIDINKDLEYEIDKQNKYFNELMSKISVITKEEYMTRHLKGVGNLIGQSLKYMGLMMLSPFAGMIPGIAMQTLATKKMVGNAYKKLHLEEEKHVRYDAINYDSELNHHIVSISYTEDLLDDTLKDVERLKEDFISIYNSNIPGYEDTLKNIEKMENKLLHNQNKVSIIKNNLKKSKKLNEDKMIKVRELNQKS